MARFTLVTRVQTKDVDEASGIAASVKNPGVLWLCNDSGDGPFLYAVDGKTGALRAYLKLPGVKPKDWEALRLDSQGVFTIADIGDNDLKRGEICLWRVPEPVLPPNGVHRLRASNPERIALHYPGSPRNAEALLVHPKTGAYFLVTKTDSGVSEVFAIPGLRVLQRLGTVRVFGEVTDGAISPGGSEIALLTYENVLLWRWHAGQSLVAALAARPVSVPLPKPLEQAEALCYAPDGGSIFVTSEGKRPPIFRLDREAR